LKKISWVSFNRSLLSNFQVWNYLLWNENAKTIQKMIAFAWLIFEKEISLKTSNVIFLQLFWFELLWLNWRQFRDSKKKRINWLTFYERLFVDFSMRNDLIVWKGKLKCCPFWRLKTFYFGWILLGVLKKWQENPILDSFNQIIWIWKFMQFESFVFRENPISGLKTETFGEKPI